MTLMIHSCCLLLFLFQVRLEMRVSDTSFNSSFFNPLHYTVDHSRTVLLLSAFLVHSQLVQLLSAFWMSSRFS